MGKKTVANGVASEPLVAPGDYGVDEIVGSQARAILEEAAANNVDPLSSSKVMKINSWLKSNAALAPDVMSSGCAISATSPNTRNSLKPPAGLSRVAVNSVLARNERSYPPSHARPRRSA